MINVYINGQNYRVNENQNLDMLLKDQGLFTNKFVVAVNGSFITKSKYASFIIGADDKIELISAMQGG